MNTEPPGPDRIRVLVSARYPSVRAGLRAMLDGLGSLTVVGEVAFLANDGELHPESADVLVADIEDDAVLDSPDSLAHSMPAVLLAPDPGTYGAILGAASGPRAYLLKGATRDEIAAAVVAVAQGLVVTDPAVVREAARGRPLADQPPSPLTEREREVLQLVAAGLPNKTIALRLGISEHTAKFHVAAILGKLGAASRTEAVTTALRTGLLPL